MKYFSAATTPFVLLALALTTGLTGCGGDDDAGVDGGTMTGADGSTMTGADGGTMSGTDGGTMTGTDGGTMMGADGGFEVLDTRTVETGAIRVAVGEERTQCASFDLGNESPAMVRAIRTHLSPGSHHMIVYHLDEAADPTFRPCGAFQHGVGASLFIAQTPEASLLYPPGAAFPVRAHQTIGVEIHYINYISETPIDISGAVDFDLIDDDPTYREVELLFTGDLSLNVPARMMSTHRSLQAAPAGAEIFALTSHTHQYGILATIHRGTSATALGEELHRSTNWAEPPLDRFDPPIVLDPGEGLVLTCVYENTSDSNIHFGTGFDDEMCFLWAYLIR